MTSTAPRDRLRCRRAGHRPATARDCVSTAGAGVVWNGRDRADGEWSFRWPHVEGRLSFSCGTGRTVPLPDGVPGGSRAGAAQPAPGQVLLATDRPQGHERSRPMTTVDTADAPVGDGVESTPSNDATGRRLVDRLGRGPTNVLTAVGFGLPVAAYFWLLLHYSVNTVFVDQWSNVPTIKASLTQALLWSALWTQHNETRMLFPNLLVVILAKTTQIRHPDRGAPQRIRPAGLHRLDHPGPPPTGEGGAVALLLSRRFPHLHLRAVGEHALGLPDRLVPGALLVGGDPLPARSDRARLAAVRRRTGSCRPGLVLAHPGVRRLADRSPAALPPKAGLVLPRDVDGRRIRHAAGVPPGLPATAGRVERGHPQSPGRDQVLPLASGDVLGFIRPPARWGERAGA